VISVDTSVLVRYLVGTPAAQAKQATALVDGQSRIGISIVALVETAHVLRTQYGVARADVLEVLIELLTRENIELLGLPKEAALSVFVRARSLPGGPIPDALIAATAEWAKALPVYTFDQEFGRHGVPVANP
jgi:predicted nucleic acid-binding protein